MVSADKPSCPSCGSELATTRSDDALLAEEYTCAVREGRSPGIDEYEGRYPKLAGSIRELFPTLMLLEDMAGTAGPESAVTAAGTTTSASPQSPPPARFIAGTILAQRYRIVGLLAAIVFQFYNFLLLNFPLPADLSAANTGGAMAVLLVALALAYYGFRTSLAGQRIFRTGPLTGLHL